jgi:hypothetical protein
VKAHKQRIRAECDANTDFGLLVEERLEEAVRLVGDRDRGASGSRGRLRPRDLVGGKEDSTSGSLASFLLDGQLQSKEMIEAPVEDEKGEGGELFLELMSNMEQVFARVDPDLAHDALSRKWEEMEGGVGVLPTQLSAAGPASGDGEDVTAVVEDQTIM